MAKIGEIRDRVQQLEQERNDQLRVKQLEDQIGGSEQLRFQQDLLMFVGLSNKRGCSFGLSHEVATTPNSFDSK